MGVATPVPRVWAVHFGAHSAMRTRSDASAVGQPAERGRSWGDRAVHCHSASAAGDISAYRRRGAALGRSGTSRETRLAATMIRAAAASAAGGCARIGGAASTSSSVRCAPPHAAPAGAAARSLLSFPSTRLRARAAGGVRIPLRCLSNPGAGAIDEERLSAWRTESLESVMAQVTRRQIPDVFTLGVPSRIAMSGEGRHLGLRAEWRQEFCTSGAFWEELKNEHVHVWWGYDGKDKVWEVDFSGLPSLLELDDMETSLLCTWIRNGTWLIPHIRDRLEVTLAPEYEPTDWQLLREQSAETNNPISAAPKGGRTAQADASEDAPTAAGEVVLEVRLREGKVKARLAVCTKTWLPLYLTLPVCGDIERTQYNRWGRLGAPAPAPPPAGGGGGGGGGDGAGADGGAAASAASSAVEVVYPREVIQVASGGGKNEYWAASACVEAGPAPGKHGLDLDARRLFDPPPIPIFPEDASFDPNAGCEVPYTQARSGHILVRPRINGREVDGVMILDTGASGFVITKPLADDLGLGAFGEL